MSENTAVAPPADDNDTPAALGPVTIVVYLVAHMIWGQDTPKDDILAALRQTITECFTTE